MTNKTTGKRPRHPSITKRLEQQAIARQQAKDAIKTNTNKKEKENE
tara:strand:- start:1087 stop:1224 length:138 start_codon:yes stop_codon:yes gene_type:complete